MKKLGAIIATGIYMLSGMTCGLLCGRVYDDTENILVSLLTLAIGMAIGLLISIAVHEAGHLVFGLLSGYSFVSYRLADIMIIKKDGKLRLKRFSLAGTAGQCLMCPPEGEDIPYVAFNLGGAIFNLLTAVIFAGLSAVTEWNPLFLMIMVLNLGTGLANAIPLHIGVIDNDGMNVFSLGKSKAALRAFQIQLRVSAAQTDGIRLSEMPDEWFTLPTDDEMKDNALVATIGVLAENRRLDALDLDGAKELIERMRRIPSTLGLYNLFLLCDLATIEYMDGDNDSANRILEAKDVRKFMRSMRNSITILRTEYISALANKRPAEEIKKQFEKVSGSYPYTGDVTGERELIALAEKKKG